MLTTEGRRRRQLRAGVLGLAALLAATASMALGASPASAFQSAYCGGGSGTYYGVGNGCTSGRHTWGWNYSQYNSGSPCGRVQEYVYRDLTGTGLSNRLSTCPNIFVDSGSDLNPYYAAGYLQRGQGTQITTAGFLYTFAQTCLQGQSCP